MKKYRVDSYEMNFSLKSSLYNTCFDDLPDVLVLEILLRLPVKTLVQSTCVNKLWFSIIKTSSFVSSYLSRSISNPSSYYIYLFSHYSSGPVMADNHHLLTRYPNYMFALETDSCQDFIGSCNGLICVFSEVISGYDIYLINPFIHKYKKLGGDNSSCYVDWIRKFNRQNIDTKVGFGYTDFDNDYKVVRIFNRYPNTRTKLGVRYDDHRIRVLESKVEFYSLKSDKWRALDVSIEIYTYHSPIFVNGCLYWSTRDLPTSDSYLLCFDLINETVSKIEFPINYLRSDRRFGHFVAKKNDTVVAISYDDGKIHLFVMEKIFGENVKWNKFYYECSSFDLTLRCLGFSGVGRLIFIEVDFDLRTNSIVAVDLDNSFEIEKHLVVDYCGIIAGANVLESLALLLD